MCFQGSNHVDDLRSLNGRQFLVVKNFGHHLLICFPGSRRRATRFKLLGFLINLPLSDFYSPGFWLTFVREQSRILQETSVHDFHFHFLMFGPLTSGANVNGNSVPVGPLEHERIANISMTIEDGIMFST